MVDYRLGVENGLDVIRNAKMNCPEQAIFLVTSWSNVVDLEQAKQAGANGVIMKAQLSSELLKKMFAPFLHVEPRQGPDD